MILPKRKLPRLQGFDYSAENYYYVTLCTYDKKNIFGRPENINEIGKIAERELLNIHTHFQGVTIDKYIIMPNHIHLLLTLPHNDGRGDPSPTMGTVMGWLKYHATKEINNLRGTVGDKIFQRSFYDHIVRNYEDYDEIRKYIQENPTRWQADRLYTEK